MNGCGKARPIICGVLAFDSSGRRTEYEQGTELQALGPEALTLIQLRLQDTSSPAMNVIEFLTSYLGWVDSPTAWVALVTLIVMEVVLGIDNLIFISILTNKLPAAQRARARRLGISAALIMRLVLLATISFIVQLTTPVFNALGHDYSWRDLILIAGGVFLVWKATREIHHNVDHDEDEADPLGHVVQMSMGAAIFQILVLDIVFSVDSHHHRRRHDRRDRDHVHRRHRRGDGDDARRRAAVALHR